MITSVSDKFLVISDTWVINISPDLPGSMAISNSAFNKQELSH
ncbi:MAG TPA: hypothetical protein PKA63_10125 [Oligoflexia bacterium]|nr:hypothetical protein [Oligoflexia bacterium]HMP49013.1 hypothetical protein [Oligoflexia bacterium]